MTHGGSALMLSTTTPPRWLGVLSAVAAAVLGTLLIYPLSHVAPTVSLAVVYLVGVLVVSTLWGPALGVVTAVLSALAFDVFHIAPRGQLAIADSRNWVALATFLMVALASSTVAELARARAHEADQRREEADLAADLARVLLRGTGVLAGLEHTAHRLASTLNLPDGAVDLELGDDSAARGETFELCSDGVRIGALAVPAGLDPATRERIAQRIVPALETVLAAALERERLQAEVLDTAMLRESDEAKTAVLRAVSHDLRSPLTAIVAAGEALHSPSLDDVERRELADAVVAQGTRLSRLIEKLLDLSRLQAGTEPAHPARVSLDELLRATVENLAVDGGRVKLALGELPPVRGDAAQLERAFANLLENALRYSGARPVSVRAQPRRGRVVVRVVDQGPGIPEVEHERIFEAFHRVPGRSAGHDGSGLGLTIVKGLVEANGGRVWVESQPGQGASFVVEIPIAADDAGQA